MVYFPNRHARTPAKQERIYKLSAERVAQFIKPFVMRRKKEEVLTELPDLIEVVYKNELEDQQKAIQFYHWLPDNPP